MSAKLCGSALARFMSARHRSFTSESFIIGGIGRGEGVSLALLGCGFGCGPNFFTKGSLARFASLGKPNLLGPLLLERLGHAGQILLHEPERLTEHLLGGRDVV